LIRSFIPCPHDALGAIILLSVDTVEIGENNDQASHECDERPDNETKEEFVVV